jgi:sulfite exporter TauE/SafE
MCGSVLLLIGRGGGSTGRRMIVAHLGRVTSYALLGASAGTVGSILGVGRSGPGAGAVLSGLNLAQGLLALAIAGLALYMALALLGRARSPEVYLARLTRYWGRAMRRLPVAPGGGPRALYAVGLLWGLLPCGLVLTALLTAFAAGAPWFGALTMLAFGLGTCPALLGVGWLAWHGLPRTSPWPRQAAALVVLLFGVQMALRGLAAWGWVSHLSIAGAMVW